MSWHPMLMACPLPVGGRQGSQEARTEILHCPQVNQQPQAYYVLAAGHPKPATLLERGGPLSTMTATTMRRETKPERGFGDLGRQGYLMILGLSREGPVELGDVEIQGLIIGALEIASLDEKDRKERWEEERWDLPDFQLHPSLKGKAMS